jgi:long-chain acyl-CoA synthetase
VILGGGTLVLDREKPTAERVFEVINRDAVEILVASPSIIQGLIDAGYQEEDFPTLKCVQSSSNVLPLETQFDFLHKFPNTRLVNFYATTECGLISAKVITEPTLSLGLPFKDIEIKIDADETGIGEIAVRGNSTATNRLTITGKKPMDEWVYPGDYAALNDEGEIILEGRRSDKMIVNGFTIYASQIERAMLKVPGVDTAVAIGVPDRRKGQKIEAFFEGNADVDDVMSHLHHWLPPYAIPASMTVTEIPLTPSGKIQKRGIR